MGIITISRGSYNKAKEVSEKVANKLGYKCISREDILSTSEDYSIPDFSLHKSIQDVKALFGRYDYAKEKYLSFFEASFYDYFKKDNVIYHGYVGVYYAKKIPNSLNVRILTDIETRIKFVMSNEGYPRDEAIKYLQKLDDARIKWALFLYDMDIRDAVNYDLTINIDKLTTDDAVDIIVNTANKKQFITTPESLKEADNLSLSAKVKKLLIGKYPQLDVKAIDGVVTIKVADGQDKIQNEIELIRKTLPEIKDIKVSKLFPFISESIKDQLPK